MVQPDASTFNCLVCVYCRLGKVREAANMLEIMLRSGQHVDATAFDAAIDACWGTGVLPLQQLAQQLLERAQQLGLYQTRVVKQVGDVPWLQPDATQLLVVGVHQGVQPKHLPVAGMVLSVWCFTQPVSDHMGAVWAFVLCRCVVPATCWTCSCLVGLRMWCCSACCC